MPTRQAAAYDEARDLLGTGDKGSAFRVLHRLRAVSLHPDDPGNATGTTDTYIDDSARLARVRAVLDDLHERSERVLLFIEDLEMQAFIAQWLRSRYGLGEVPIINGGTPVPRRHEQVKRFQELDPESREFGVFILSPRAAGFGITLTTATHVVHLTRWWNPAVEEQCNDRIYRIGQTRDVTVHLPMAIHPTTPEQSFDHVLDELLRHKWELARSALWPPAVADRDLGQLVEGLLGTGPPVDSLHPAAKAPELVCRRTLDGWGWTLALSGPEALEVDEALHDDRPLEQVDHDWEIPSCGRQAACTDSGQQSAQHRAFCRQASHLQVDGRLGRARASGSRGWPRPLSRRRPEEWRRTGRTPNEPDPCGEGFLVHYFHFEAYELIDEVEGFEGHPLPSTGPGFTLDGPRVFDDTDDSGLFGELPVLELAQEVKAAWLGPGEGDDWPGEAFDPRTTALEEVTGRS